MRWKRRAPHGRRSDPRPSPSLRDLLTSVPVLPVLTVERAEQAVPLARALAAGGLTVLEVTLRSTAALEAIRRIRGAVPEVEVGAGTVTRPSDLAAVRDAGGAFAVSPGLTGELAVAAGGEGLPLLPGVMTPSEALAARERGFSLLKLFPAGPAGGIALLKALHGPLPDLAFCPTGGIGARTFRDYLALPNVVCVGGSWVAPRDAIRDGDWQRITHLAREAASVRSQQPEPTSGGER